MDRDLKRMRLNRLRFSLPHMSQSALTAFAKAAKAGDLPDISSRQELKAAVDWAVSQTTPYGSVLVNVDLVMAAGQSMRVEVANPLALYWAASKTTWYAKLLWDTYQRKPCSPDSPWTWTLYCDDAKIGNKMKYENRRNVCNVYSAFMEFGPWALSKEEFWLPLGVIRVLDLAKVEAGVFASHCKSDGDIQCYLIVKKGVKSVANAPAGCHAPRPQERQHFDEERR